ncbi:MAG: hypothetical protein AAF235_04425 [Planctomycetota bacterium]
MAKKTAKKTTKKPAKKTARKTAGGSAREHLISFPPPGHLAGIIGQPRATGILQSTLVSERLHHCWLFSGPQGVGKFTAALAFAWAILDPTTSPDLAGAPTPDETSEVAQLLKAGSHPDLHVVTKELAPFSRDPAVRRGKQTTIPADVLRQFLIEPAVRAASLQGGLASKVFIVDEAELMGGGQRVGQNALLKTLEEPPPGTVIILVTASEDRLLPTIRSRSQRVAFTPLADDTIRTWASARGLDTQAIDEALPLAEGSPGRLIELVEHGDLRWYQTIRPMLDQTVEGRFPVKLGDTMTRLIKEHADAWVKADDRRSKEVANRAAAERIFRLIASHMRGGLQSRASAPIAIASVEAIGRAEQRIAANTQMGMVMEALAADLAEAGR